MEIEWKKIHPKRGDIILCRIKGDITPEMVADIKARWNDYFPKYKGLIISDNFDIEILKKKWKLKKFLKAKGLFEKQ